MITGGLPALLAGNPLGYAGFHPPETGTEQPRIWFLVDMDTALVFPKPYAWLSRYTHEQANFDIQVYARNFVMRVYLYDPQGELGHYGYR